MNQVTFTEAEREAGRKVLRHFDNKASRWTQGAMSRDARGTNCRTGLSSEAVCWCLSGAAVACDVPITLLGDAAAKALNIPARDFSIVAWNDSLNRTFFEVRDLLESIANGCPEPKEGT